MKKAGKNITVKGAFQERSKDKCSKKRGHIFVTRNETAEFVLSDVSLKLPDGTELVQPFTQKLKKGDRLMLTGPSGSGKSTLLRAMAGFWPYGDGEVRWPKDSRVLIVPQKPYLPNVSLRGILSYPNDEAEFDNAQFREVLKKVGHDKLVDYLDDETIDGDKLSRQLSLGEQQRLVFARILLHKPDVLMLDEVTASLDESSGRALYKLMVDNLPDTILISVAHKMEIMQYHTLHADLTGRKWTIRPIDAEKLEQAQSKKRAGNRCNTSCCKACAAPA